MLANSILLPLSDFESSADARTLPPRGGQLRAAHRARGPARGVHGAGLKAPRFTNRDVPQKGTWEILLNPAFSVQNSLVRASSSLLLYLAQVNPAGTEFTRLPYTVLKRKPLSVLGWNRVTVPLSIIRLRVSSTVGSNVTALDAVIRAHGTGGRAPGRQQATDVSLP